MKWRHICEGVEEKVKILFTGHRGSGKSTELSKLASLLTDRFFIVNFSIAQGLNLYDLNYVDVILAMALKLFQKTHEHKIRINKLLQQDILIGLLMRLLKRKLLRFPKRQVYQLILISYQ